MNQIIRFCTTPDGVRLGYAVSGTGPPLVMSATWLTHLEHQWRSLAWRPWLDAFSRGRKLLRYDARGCGLSDRDTGDFSFDNWVSDFECVIDAAGIGRFDLLATCWGGPIAIAYAARHPERVNRLILYGTYALGRMRWKDRPNEIEKARLLLDLTRLGWGHDNHAFQQVWATAFQPGGTLDHLHSWCDQQRAATSAETAVRLLQIGWSADVREAARKIKCPVLIVHPERDAVVPLEQGRLLASLIPNSRFVPISTEITCRSLTNQLGFELLTRSRRSLMSPPSAKRGTGHCRSTRSRRASEPSSKASQEDSIIQRLPPRSGFRKKPSATTSRTYSTRSV